MSILMKMATVSCSCNTCKEMCKRPCWPSPEEAEKMILSGYAQQMMLDYWINSDSSNTYIVCPAEKGSEGGVAPSFPLRIGCTLQDENGMCKLHDSGFKPIEARLAICDMQRHKLNGEMRRVYAGIDLHESVMKLWGTDKGRSIVEFWKVRVGLAD